MMTELQFILMLIGIPIFVVLGVMYLIRKKLDREVELILRLDNERKTMSDENLKMIYDWLLEIDEDFPYDIMLELCKAEMQHRKRND